MTDKKQSDLGKHSNESTSNVTKINYAIEQCRATVTHGTIDSVTIVRNDLAPPPPPNRSDSEQSK